MSRRAWAFAAVVLLVAAASPGWAGDKGEKEKSEVCRSRTVASLLMGIQSDNQGLRESAAYVLGEIKCTEAVIPLMRMLHEDGNESGRIAAALALSLIGEPRGVFAVRRAVIYDDSPRVRRVSAFFYNQYVHPQTFAFFPVVKGDTVHYASK